MMCDVRCDDDVIGDRSRSNVIIILWNIITMMVRYDCCYHRCQLASTSNTWCRRSFIFVFLSGGKPRWLAIAGDTICVGATTDPLKSLR